MALFMTRLVGATMLLGALYAANGLPHAPRDTDADRQHTSVSPLILTLKEEGALSALADNAKPAQFITGLENLPPSFRGTDPDGELRADNQGNLVIQHEIRLLFDYFLAGIGEEPQATIAARIRAYIEQQLPEPAATQANQLLDAYLALLDGSSALDKPDTATDFDTDTIAGHLQLVSELRRTYLPHDVADAFFGEDEAYDRYTLGKLSILKNAQLSAEEKNQQIASLESQLPEDLQRFLQRSQQAVQLHELTNELRNQGGTNEELYQRRSEQVGADAAERLAQLDIDRAQWKNRIDSWLVDRENFLRDPQLSRADKPELLAQWRNERFNGTEVNRVEALERIHDGDGTSPKNVGRQIERQHPAVIPTRTVVP